MALMAYVDLSNTPGAALKSGGSHPDGPGYFVEPTVFSSVKNGIQLALEEVLGQVLAIILFKDEDDAVFQASHPENGLVDVVWTKDIARGIKVARVEVRPRLNQHLGEADPMMPFGGYKQSGLGREFGAESIDRYTQTEAVPVWI